MEKRRSCRAKESPIWIADRMGVATSGFREARMEAEINTAQRLHALGQSLWLDSINRVMLRTGALARYVQDLAVTGLTSNPTILGHAMAAGSDYDSSLVRLASEGVTGAQDLVYALALEDLAAAAALFRAEWDRTGGADGYVSLEVPPDVAYDAAATVALARRLHEQAGFPNLLVKIPGTPPGLTAMEEAITAGIGVNVTLLFSDSHYLRTADAYIRALQRRLDAGLDLAVPSVASVFISRWDSAADPLLPPALHGVLGLAMAQKTYSSHLALQAFGEGVNVDSRVSHRGNGLLGRGVVRVEALVERSVIGEGEQRLFRDGVDGVGGGQAAQIVGVGQVWVLGRGGCPQDPLRPGASLGKCLPALVRQQPQLGGVSLLRHRQPERAMKRRRQQRVGGRVPAGDKHRGHRGHR